ncbi:MAG TPA: hypothetical protein VFL42_04945, partial [Terriglobales bacterium]|nr:hypothetical protein [Terriglobales bacterium]
IAVFWGPNVDTAVTAPGAIDQFFTDITKSRYYDLLTEYSTAGITSSTGASSNQSIQRGVFDGSFTITPSVCNTAPPATCTINDTQIQAELRNQINAAQLPTPVADAQGNVNSFYIIYFPPGVSITVGSPPVGSCVQGGFCAYHSNTPNTLAPRLVPYGVLPDFGPTSGCTRGCGGGTIFQNVTAVTSHELSEAVTDALVGSAIDFAPPLAWYDPDPAANPLAEIGDICTAQDVIVQAGANSYAVQTEFSNVQNDCVGAPPTFNLSTPPAIAQNISATLTLTIQSSVNASALAGYVGTVHFTSSDALAVLPTDYSFTASDAGTHAFPVTLKTLGSQTITASDVRSGGFTGTATVTVSNAPDLTILKTHSGAFVQGQFGDYSIVVSNSGALSTSGTVTVTDALPSGLTATQMTGTGWTCTLATLTCTRSDALAPTASYPPLSLAVNVAANAPSSVTNVATVSGGSETNTANNTAQDITAINPPPVPDLNVNKFHAGTFFQGQTDATYTLLVFNTGGAPTTGTVTVTDTLPAGLLATAIAGTGWSCDLPTLTCTRSDALVASAGISYPPISVTVNIAPDAAANVNNKATVSGGGETNTSNDTSIDATVIQPALIDLAVVTSHAFNFVQGQKGAVFAIRIDNVGNTPSAGTVTVVDTLPTGLTATDISGIGWNCTLATTTCTRSDSLPGANSYPAIFVTVDVAANAPGIVVNKITLSGGADGNAANNTASDTTIINPPLFMVLGSSAASVSAGQSGVFTFTVSATPAVGTVTFSCSGLPAQAACNFNPTSTSLPSTSVVLNISTTARAASVGGFLRPSSAPLAPLMPVLLVSTIMAAISYLQRKKIRVAFAIAGLALVLVVAGCGGGGSGSTPNVQGTTGTPAGTYAITITATGANSLTATQTVSLTVK